jgi:four helix bundle protein
MSLALLVIMPIKSYRDLQAWQLGMALAEEVYALTRAFPKDELFGLTSQLRRAATGIPSHIAEGHQHGINAYRHYVTIALGSQAECETQLELALRLKFASPEKINKVKDRAAEVGRVLHGLSRSLSRAASRG